MKFVSKDFQWEIPFIMEEIVLSSDLFIHLLENNLSSTQFSLVLPKRFPLFLAKSMYSFVLI